MAKRFTRKIEDFLCENCGVMNKGNGYTNHCFSCLWSKHVDVNPGDREGECFGLMEPKRVEIKDARYSIVHKCKKCGHVKKNIISQDDNMNTVFLIAKESGNG